MNACPVCGSAISPDARFCGQCGHTIDVEQTRRIPTTVDEATMDPPAEPNPAKPTQLGSADLNKTISDNASIDRILAGLEWEPPPSEPSAVPTTPAPATGSGIPTTPVGAPTALGVPVASTPPERRATALGVPVAASELEATAHGVPVATEPAPARGATALGVPAVAPPPEPAAPVGAPTALGVPVASPSEPATPVGAPTALGVPAAPPSEPAPVPEPPPSARKPMFGATMIGGSITAADVMAESTRRMQAPEPEPKREPLKTMVGHAVLDKPASDSPQVPPAAPSDPQAYRPAFKTMLGVALPGIAPVRDSERSMTAALPQAPAPRSPEGTLQGGVGAPVPVPPSPSSSQRIAPAPAPNPQPQLQPVPPIVPPPAPIVEEPLPQAPAPLRQAKKGISAVVLVSILVVVVVAIGTAAAVVMLRAGAPLSAKARLDESGKESLEIRCESCPNDTKISLGASSATVTDATAVLPLAIPLKIGDNDLDIAIDRPGAGRDETVKIHVPIAYRVKADLTTLTSMPPVVTVRVEAAPGTEVTVDDKPVALDPSGKGSYALDVSADALGPSDDQKAIDRQIPFSVTRKGAKAPEPGTLVVRAAVVPLHMDAPGVDLFTESTTANIVGQTKAGGVVTVDGQTLAVDENGRFAIRAELPAEGEKILTIVATAPPLAPRTVRAKVTRVASLEAQAQAIDATTPLGFDAYGAEPAAKLGAMVVINGEIVEIRNSPGYAVMVIEEKKTCAAGGGCILRFSIGEDIRAVRGDTIRAYGHVAGTVAWNNKSVPAVTGTLAITSKAAKK